MPYSFILVDESNKEHKIEFTPNEYDNLMVLIFDQCIEEWGDCRGRAWCGTCHIELIDGKVADDMDTDEHSTLRGLSNLSDSSRLACQIQADEQLNGLRFRVLKD